jgi:hypothetical protein
MKDKRQRTRDGGKEDRKRKKKGQWNRNWETGTNDKD